MGLLTLYNVVSPWPAAEFPRVLSDILAPLGLVVGETFEREDSSQLVLFEHADPPMSLGVAVVPLVEGQFQPAGFDAAGNADAGWVASIRTVCRVGAEEGPDPAAVVQKGLAVAAGIAAEGRIYDLHAMLAIEADAARTLASGDFDIRRFLTYHYLAPPSGEAEHSWLHLHGMTKFFRPDLEAFDVHPDVSHKALALLMHLAEELAQGREVPAPDVSQPYGHGAFLVRPSEDVRPHLTHFDAAAFEDEHTGPTFAVEDAGAYRSLDKLLRGAYELDPKTREECDAEQRVWQERIEGIQKAWLRHGGQLIVRVGLEVGKRKGIEHIWVDIESWNESTVVGRLLNDAFGDPALVVGTEISFDQELISGVSVTRGEEVLDEVETLREVDKYSAELLDSTLATPSEEIRVVEGASPQGQVVARFIDDGQVGALHLIRASDGAQLCDPIWLFNRRPTPPIIDTRRLTTVGRAPLLSEVYTDQRTPSEAPEAGRAELFWEGDRVSLVLDGELWAVGDAAEACGWSRMIALAGRFGRPFYELEAEAGAASADVEA